MHRISYDSSVTLFILHRSEKRQSRISRLQQGCFEKMPEMEAA
ncbi:Uncharacterised protein [Enterobacter ludwigii]|uniref:Uncharacterized protein n=1 Tax=Klebsiella quasivariicola TaxID=2026240 RepID=A0A8B4TXV1_9ENTR|nr:hypothetical protein AZ036_005929 [Klebsiella michiganensis]SAG07258.1 Uncharacterised protein [Enterobacter ludwigii]SAJ20494.1 Uncharacterised protein [Enterobacter hormaechei]SAQ60593.1 Uncharacterised protein [Klebsiella oxytoca]SBL85184.1 Uncharacterised protein [Klebsiella grimontii]SQA59946.1 Uncharacterised protein [Raoultella planticola]SXE02186.1 Uncharacterised protein [Klebsiella quasivariicola]